MTDRSPLCKIHSGIQQWSRSAGENNVLCERYMRVNRTLPFSVRFCGFVHWSIAAVKTSEPVFVTSKPNDAFSANASTFQGLIFARFPF